MMPCHFVDKHQEHTSDKSILPIKGGKCVRKDEVIAQNPIPATTCIMSERKYICIFLAHSHNANPNLGLSFKGKFLIFPYHTMY